MWMENWVNLQLSGLIKFAKQKIILRSCELSCEVLMYLKKIPLFNQ